MYKSQSCKILYEVSKFTVCVYPTLINRFVIKVDDQIISILTKSDNKNDGCYAIDVLYKKHLTINFMDKVNGLYSEKEKISMFHVYFKSFKFKLIIKLKLE